MRWLVVVGMALVLSLLACHATKAVTTTWIDPFGGNFNDPSNWDLGVPGSGDLASFPIDTTGPITFSTSPLVGTVLIAGNTGTHADVTFNLGGRTLRVLNDVQISLGETSGAIREGDWVINGPGLVDVNGIVNVGIQLGGTANDGYGYVTVQNGATLDAATLDIDHGRVRAGSGGTIAAGSLFSQGLIQVFSGGELTANSLRLQDLTFDSPKGVLSILGGNATIGSLTEDLNGQVSPTTGTNVTITGGSLTVGSYTYNGNFSTLDHRAGTLIINGGTFNNGNTELTVSSGSGTPTMRFQDGATASVSVLSVGVGSGDRGILEVDGFGSIVQSAGDVYVGDGGTGEVNITGGAVSSVGEVFIGDNGGNGSIEIDGDGSRWTHSGLFTVGDNSAGTAVVRNEGVLDTSSGVVGRRGGSDGSHVTITGAGSKWQMNGRLEVGQVSDATLDILNGGVVTNATVGIAEDAGSTSVVTVDGAGSTWTVNGTGFDDFVVGQAGTGTLNITNGGTVNGFYLDVGGAGGASGTVNVDGTDSLLDLGAQLVIGPPGSSGSGTLTVTNGGQVNSFDGWVQGISGTTASATVSGSDSQWQIDRNLTLLSAGTLTVQSQGAVVVQGATTLSSSDGGASVGTLNINGGSLTTGSLDNSNGGTLNHTHGMLIIDGGTFDNGGNALSVGSTVGFPQLWLQAGATASHSSVSIGTGPFFESGTVVVTGSGSHLNSSGRINISDVADSSAHLLVADGAQVDSGDDIFIGLNGGHGRLTIESGSEVNSGDFTVVTGDEGTLIVQTGGVLNSSDSLNIANLGSQASATVTGPGSQINIDGGAGQNNDLTVGVEGTGTMTIAAGASVTASDVVFLAREVGSDGTLMIDDATLHAGNELIIGLDGTGQMTVDGGAAVHVAANTPHVTVGMDLEVAPRTGSVGTFTARNGARVEVGDDLLLGAAGGQATFNVETDATVDVANVTVVGQGPGATRSLNITSGGILNGESDVNIANQANSTGQVIVSGAGSQINIGQTSGAGGLIVGDEGMGTMTVESGATVLANDYLRIGQADPTSDGTLTIDGVASSVNVAGETSLVGMIIGNQGVGTLNITGGATLTNAVIEPGETESNAEARIGNSAGGTGVATIDGAGSTWNNAGPISIGYSGVGTLNITNGGLLTSNETVIGRLSGSDGSAATVDGAGSRWENDFEIEVGQISDATLEILDGGVVTSAQGEIAEDASSTSSVLIDGSDSLWDMTGSLFIGGGSTASGGTGSMTIQNSGSATVGATTTLWNSNTTLTINGGTLTTGSLDNSHGGTLNHTDGTIIIDGGTFSISSTTLKVASTTGTPILEYTNGASSSVGGVRLGELDGESGEIKVTGTGSNVTTTGDFFVADQTGSQGTLTVGNGGLINVGDDFAAGIGGGNGTITVHSGGMINVADETTIGRQSGGNGTMTISGGAVFNGEERLQIARDANSEGHVLVTGTGSQLNLGQTSGVGQLRIGREGIGSFTVEAGATADIAGGVRLGVNTADADGTLTIDGAGSQVTTTVTSVVGTIVGNNGTGTLNITNGGSLTNVEGRIGNQPGAVGIALVDGAGSIWTNTGPLRIGGDNSGDGGTGTLTIRNSGTVNVSDTTILWGSDDTLTLDNGTLRTGAWNNANGGIFNFTAGTFAITNDDAYIGTSGTGSGLGNNFTVPTSSTLEITGGATQRPYRQYADAQ